MADSLLRTEIQVRYGDLDTLGHVNNAVYLTYFELGRVLYFRKYLPAFDARNVRFVIARAEVDFRKSITMEDNIFLETSLDSVGNTSFTFLHRITNRDGSVIYAEGKIVAVSIDENRKPTPVPDELRKLMD